MSSELITGLITAVITLISVTALNAKAAAAEKSLFLEMVKNQEKRVYDLERNLRQLAAKYSQAKTHGEKLEEKLEAERKDCSQKINILQARVKDLETNAARI